MRKHLYVKAIAMALVVVACGAVGVYPLVSARLGLRAPHWLLEKQLKLGLDLKGGVNLEMRVETDFALRLETDQESERLREALMTRSVMFTDVTALTATQFRVDGVPLAQAAAFREAANEVQTNFDRSPGANGTYTFTMKPTIASQLRDEAVVQARETIERRINELGVTEPSLSQQGTDELLVQLPGVANVEKAKAIMGSPGLLELKIVEQGPVSTKDALLVGGWVPAGMEVVPGSAGPHANPAETAYYLVRKVAAVTGRDLRNARPSLDENNQPAVSFTLSNDGGRKFGTVTAGNIGRPLAIILDGRVQSAPRIDARITTDGRIAGGFTTEEAQNLSLILRSGALPAPLDYLSERTIGPSLGADSIRSGILASAIGLLLIVVFMLVYYRLSGINAVIALVCNLVMLLGLMAYIGQVMTLPGIAGFVLTMGIGVDSNVLIFERIKEELAKGHGVRRSISTGFSHVLWTLMDTHIAALISAAFLFNFGTGPIRGFAVTLFFGLVSNLFTSVFVSKTLFELVLSRRREVTTLSI